MDPAPARPRDVVGRGGRSPLPRWPDGSLVAVNLVVNVEERADLEHAMRVLPELVGRPVRGWYVRSFPSPHTRGLAARATAVRDFLAHVAGEPEIALVHRGRIAEWWEDVP